MPTQNSRHAVYVGSFDPVTLGHEDLIRRGADVFDSLTVGVGINPSKSPLFTVEERITLIRSTFEDLPNVQVQSFSGLAVDFVRSLGAKVMLRGLRTLTDIEAEFTMSLANRVLSPELETVFLMASEKYTHISSSLIKQIAQMGGEGTAKQLENFVPANVIPALLEKIRPS
ncbi:pantetheine-phosphate adenylyltransferase [Thalassoroseus pseudoceratinae]|uniref:pantetheine-phosphate adenylyltransferase n=1 Tax=Thalassoroseus pseudoceratinae TaxID=2713176 RepID=UPI00142141D7|nr:pantetheine-phosphate adenylyltransferase [Thalassoroseus pseudoceratinae]